MLRLTTLVLLFATCASSQLRIPLKFKERVQEQDERVRTTGVIAALPISYDSDGLYYAQISIGTPPQKFTVALDTLTADLWVPSAKCYKTDIPCWRHNDYYSDQSSTYINNGTDYTIVSALGTGSGYISTDTVEIANLPVTNQSFAEITWLGSEFLSTPYDGVLGLGFASLSHIGTPSFINLVHQHQLEKPFFALYLKEKGGELSLAYTNPAYFTGKFDFVHILKPAKYWSFNLTQINVGGNDVGVNHVPVILDSTNKAISGPADQIMAINTAIGAYYDSSIDRFTIHCKDKNKKPNVTFVVDKRGITLTPNDYIYEKKYVFATTCMTRFAEIKTDPGIPNAFILGTTFLQKVYTQFNTGHGTIGFADVV